MEFPDDFIRCEWAIGNTLMTDYHDHEWGMPVHDDIRLFENFVLDGFQAGLSWLTILKKREAFRIAFDFFNIQTVASYDEHKIVSLLQNRDIIRNRQKILSAVHNAGQVSRIQEEFGTFDNYLWNFVNGKSIINRWSAIKEIPSTSEVSDKMSKDLKKRGFSFAGSTICYAFMQAVGMVNDHIKDCFRYSEINS